MKMNSAKAMFASLLLAAGASGSLAAFADAALTDAEVRKVDRDNQKVTLKHGEIKNLDMPPMTMVFTVSDPKLLQKVQAGDKVRFRAINEAGKITVTEIQPAK